MKSNFEVNNWLIDKMVDSVTSSFIDKQSVHKLDPTLENIISTCQAGLPNLIRIKGKDLLLILGNTGSGKSTLMSSLAFGPSNHKVGKVKVVCTQPDGKESIHWSKIID